MEIAARPLSWPRAHSAAVPALAGLVVLSSALHVVVAWLRATPVYFSDEYMYAELGRSFAESGLPLVRGELAPFPALLYPLLTAPAWLLGDVELSYRIVQLFGAVAMSLACLPAYLLARRLGVGRTLAFGVAALTIAVPDVVYAGWVLAETVAYPLALAAVAAGTVALSSPSRRSQVLFLALAALATAARVQFVVLFAVYPLAVALLGLGEQRVRAVAREQTLTLATLAAGVACSLAFGPRRALGIYGTVLDVDLDLPLLVERVGGNAIVLAYAAAWILLPGAVLGFALGLARPRSRAERCFSALGAPLTLALVLEASLFATPDHVQERYAFYALPLLAVAFAVYAARGWPLRLVHAGLAASLLCAAALVPLSGYTPGDGKAHSATLLALGRLELALGDAPAAALLVATVAGVLLLSAIACSLHPRLGTPIALALALTGSGTAAVGATAFDLENARGLRAGMLPSDPSWVERAADGAVTLVRTPGGVRTEAMEQLFWNPSVDRVALLPGAPDLDAFHSERVAVADDGSLDLPAGALLVETRATWIELRDAHRLTATAGYALWQPLGRPRLSLLLAGRYSDGWLAAGGELRIWPRRAGRPVSGRLRLQLSAPAAAGELTFRFRSPGSPAVEAVVPGGATRAVVLTVCSARPWRATFSADKAGFVGSRLVSGSAAPPVFQPDDAVCRQAVPRPGTPV